MSERDILSEYGAQHLQIADAHFEETEQQTAASAVGHTVEKFIHEGWQTGAAGAAFSTSVMLSGHLYLGDSFSRNVFRATGGLSALAGGLNLAYNNGDAQRFFSATTFDRRTQYGLQSAGDIMQIAGGLGSMIPQVRTAALVTELAGIGLRWATPMFYPDDKTK